MFVLNSAISIGDFHFSGVHEVTIKRSIHDLMETAEIKIPAMAAISKNGNKTPERQITSNMFREGDQVVIKLGYNDAIETEFSGYLKSRKLTTPLVLECEGQSWLLKTKRVNSAKTNGRVNTLLAEALSNQYTEISVDCNIAIDIVSANANPVSVQDAINGILHATDNNLCCFFRRDGSIWCGTLYSDIASGQRIGGTREVKYRIGYNTLKENKLTIHNREAQPATIIYTRKAPSGSIISGMATGKGNEQKLMKVLNQVLKRDGLEMLAKERMYKNTYQGYEGSFVSLLQPFVWPGDLANIENTEHPELDGLYLVESTEVLFGTKGAGRTMEIGPRLGFDK